MIHRAGRPAHEDLYSDEIPVALGELGVRFATYAGPRGYAPFASWTKEALRAGDPVLAGVKILPTAHPTWGLDHFVLVVGHGPKGLLVNTTWGHRAWVADTETPGLSLKNAFYGLRLQGLVLGPDAAPARLTFRDETDAGVKLRVTCPTLTKGRIERRASRSDRRPVWTHDGVDVEVTLPPDQPARFQCVGAAPR
jgi:hypothetical protein